MNNSWCSFPNHICGYRFVIKSVVYDWSISIPIDRDQSTWISWESNTCKVIGLDINCADMSRRARFSSGFAVTEKFRVGTVIIEKLGLLMFVGEFQNTLTDCGSTSFLKSKRFQTWLGCVMSTRCLITLIRMWTCVLVYGSLHDLSLFRVTEIRFDDINTKHDNS